MSTSPDSLFDSALSLPEAQRADLAFQLLQTLTPTGDEITANEFGAQLHERVAGYRRGEIQSFGIDEAGAAVQQQLADRRAR